MRRGLGLRGAPFGPVACLALLARAPSLVCASLAPLGEKSDRILILAKARALDSAAAGVRIHPAFYVR